MKVITASVGGSGTVTKMKKISVGDKFELSYQGKSREAVVGSINEKNKTFQTANARWYNNTDGSYDFPLISLVEVGEKLILNHEVR